MRKFMSATGGLQETMRAEELEGRGKNIKERRF